MNELSTSYFSFYYIDFLTISLIHLFAVVSPGPDFIIIVKQCNSSGRKFALFTSFGISLGILFHISYCILGISIIQDNIFFMNLVKVLGGLYLFYIGCSSFLKVNKINSSKIDEKVDQTNYLNSFLLGFITNVFNPKATLFFISLFSLFINASTPLFVKIFYGFWMSLVTGIWFCLVSLFFTSKIFEIFISKYSLIIDKIMGVLLVLISTKLIFF